MRTFLFAALLSGLDLLIPAPSIGPLSATVSGDTIKLYTPWAVPLSYKTWDSLRITSNPAFAPMVHVKAGGLRSGVDSAFTSSPEPGGSVGGIVCATVFKAGNMAQRCVSWTANGGPLIPPTIGPVTVDTTE